MQIWSAYSMKRDRNPKHEPASSREGVGVCERECM